MPKELCAELSRCRNRIWASRERPDRWPAHSGGLPISFRFGVARFVGHPGHVRGAVSGPMKASWGSEACPAGNAQEPRDRVALLVAARRGPYDLQLAPRPVADPADASTFCRDRSPRRQRLRVDFGIGPAAGDRRGDVGVRRVARIWMLLGRSRISPSRPSGWFELPTNRMAIERPGKSLKEAAPRQGAVRDYVGLAVESRMLAGRAGDVSAPAVGRCARRHPRSWRTGNPPLPGDRRHDRGRTLATSLEALGGELTFVRLDLGRATPVVFKTSILTASRRPA